MIKKILVSGLALLILTGCGWVNPPQNPTPPTASAAPLESPTPLPQPTATLRLPIRDTPTPEAIPPEAIQPTTAVGIAQPVAVSEDTLEEPLYAVQPGTPTRVTNFLVPEAGCSYLGIAGQVFDMEGQPVQGLIVEVTGELDGNPVLQLVLTGSATRLGPGGFEIKLADRAIESQGALTIQIFDLAGLALSAAIPFDTSQDCDANQVLLNFTANKLDFDEILYFPFVPSE